MEKLVVSGHKNAPSALPRRGPPTKVGLKPYNPRYKNRQVECRVGAESQSEQIQFTVEGYSEFALGFQYAVVICVLVGNEMKFIIPLLHERQLEAAIAGYSGGVYGIFELYVRAALHTGRLSGNDVYFSEIAGQACNSGFSTGDFQAFSGKTMMESRWRLIEGKSNRGNVQAYFQPGFHFCFFSNRPAFFRSYECQPRLLRRAIPVDRNRL